MYPERRHLALACFLIQLFLDPNHIIKGDVSIEYKPGRYRVTVWNITSTLQRATTLEAVGTVTHVESILVKSDKFRPSWKKSVASIFEIDFDKVFKIFEVKSKEW